MRNRNLFLFLTILLASVLVAGCGTTRQLTKGETDQFKAISVKIDTAEGMTPKGAKVCAPKELAAAKVERDYAHHETVESWETPSPFIVKADKAADAVLAKTVACQMPVVNLSANPDTISPGQCSTLTWTMEYAKKGLWGPGKKPPEIPTNGSKEVCPTETTDYQVGANGPGGTVYAVATVTVVAPAPPPPPPPPPPPAPVPAPERKVIDRLTIRVNFDFDKSTIRKADVADLEKAVAFVKKYPDSKVVLVGHTDSVGTEKYNLKLSQRRADAVKKYLVEKGEKTDRITTEAKGESEPIASNKTAKGRFENRRVEILIIGD